MANPTIGATTPRIQYTATASQTVFTVPFEFLANADLAVYVNGTLKTLITDYTLTGANTTGGGSLTFVTGRTAGDIVTILGNLAYSRDTNKYTKYGLLPAEVLEADFDAMQVQAKQLARDGQFALRAPLTDTGSPSMTLPVMATRTSKALGFDASGNPTVSASSLADIDSTVQIIDTLNALPAGASSSISYQPAGTGAVTTTVQAKLREIAVDASDFGLKGDGTTNDQAAMDALLNSSNKIIRFKKGIYRAYLNNSQSDRTFIFDEGAIIDGVAHIAIGSGPETPASLSIVKNVRVIGTIASTVRVGTFYCKNVNIDKIRIEDVNASYANQTAEGGTKGVHFYYGSKDIYIGEIDTQSTAASTAAFFIDTATLNDSTNRPNNIYVGFAHIRAAATSAVSLINADNVVINRILVDAFTGYNGIQFTGSDVVVGSISIDGTSTVGAYPNVYILNNTRARIGSVLTKNSKSIGFYVSGSTNTVVNSIEATGNASDGVRLLSPAIINDIVATSNTGNGVYCLTPCTNAKIRTVTASSNGAQGVTVDSSTDVSIDEVIVSSNAGASGFGLFLNSATRFRNNYLYATGNFQGLRYINVTDADLGVVIATGNSSNDLAFSGTNSGVSFSRLKYSTSFGGTLQDVPGYKGKLQPRGSKTQGDNDVTLIAGTDVTTQRFGTPLTANRTVTLSTTGVQPGDWFRVVRTAAATGAFNLDVGGLKTLAAAGQWCEVEYTGTVWALTANGAL